MKLNSEFTEDVGLACFGRLNAGDSFEASESFTRTELKNDHMLRLQADFNKNFIRNTGTLVVINGMEMDIREANIREMAGWFELALRRWIDVSEAMEDGRR